MCFFLHLSGESPLWHLRALIRAYLSFRSHQRNPGESRSPGGDGPGEAGEWGDLGGSWPLLPTANPLGQWASNPSARHSRSGGARCGDTEPSTHGCLLQCVKPGRKAAHLTDQSRVADISFSFLLLPGGFMAGDTWQPRAWGQMEAQNLERGGGAN